MKATPRGQLSRSNTWTPVPATKSPLLLVNPRSGDGKAQRVSLAGHARTRGIEVVILDPGADPAAIARHAVADGADALGVAGGDGSLASVAAVAREAGLPFVCVPAGTRNHFALDLGVDRNDVVGALDAFVDGHERWIDIAEVNGQMFLNNVSLGVYGDAVHDPRYRDAKLRTLLDTARTHMQPSAVAAGLHIVDDVGREHIDPAAVLISNNPYALQPLPGAGTRPTLSSGTLGVIVLDARGTTEFPPARAWNAKHVSIDAATATHGGVDGEAQTLQPPLEITIHPSALRVRISARHPGSSPSARFPQPRGHTRQ